MFPLMQLNFLMEKAVEIPVLGYGNPAEVKNYKALKRCLFQKN